MNDYYFTYVIGERAYCRLIRAFDYFEAMRQWEAYVAGVNYNSLLTVTLESTSVKKPRGIDVKESWS